MQAQRDDRGRPVRLRRGFRRLAIGAFVILMPIAAWSLWDYVEARRLAALVREIQSRGEQVDPPEDSKRAYDHPDNAARYYEAAAALLDRRELYGATGIMQAMHFELQDRDTVMRRVAGWLQANAEAERLLGVATDHEFTGFPPWVSDTLLYDRMSALARMAALRAMERAHAGDGDAAARAVYVQLRVGRAVESASGWSDIHFFSVERALQDLGPVLSAAPGESALVALQQALTTYDGDRAIERSALRLRAELIASLWDHNREWYGRPRVRFNQGSPIEPLVYHVSRPWFAHRLNAEIRVMNRAVEQARKPWPERLHFEGPDAPPRPPGGFLHIFRFDHPAEVMRYLNKSQARGIARMLAYVRTGLPAIAVARYRLANGGALPGSLDELVPGYLGTVPVDPFSGSTVRYRPIAGGYVVYSSGVNGKDDGGRTQIEAKQRMAAARSDRDPLDVGVEVKFTDGGAK